MLDLHPTLTPLPVFPLALQVLQPPVLPGRHERDERLCRPARADRREHDDEHLHRAHKVPARAEAGTQNGEGVGADRERDRQRQMREEARKYIDNGAHRDVVALHWHTWMQAGRQTDRKSVFRHGEEK